ncbi:hypothetical protein BOW37_12775 [Solemya velum gill symbiont]|nr:hypothetical protein BOV97_13005 [Solemya velum gill symbiont]OOY67215.1 hypothetical protein BOW07_13110 [Solemya velum gill symbiont]OOY76685.1 hypothetical protein BOW11_13200 [Solemya velum gill symbiont]OOY96096.1 hypothetical protein BOW19_11660 [Solemya velum gill symbiont]OOZ05298.1 hypothetical protein BOW23_11575 [Solemya velum gill symbiont]
MTFDHFLYLTNEDSKDTHPENTVTDFTIDLPKPLNLEGTWECALLEVGFSDNFKSDILYICTDVCEESVVCDTSHPVLRSVFNRSGSKKGWSLKTFDKPIYLRLTRADLQRIRVNVRGPRLVPLEIEGVQIACILHLRRVI